MTDHEANLILVEKSMAHCCEKLRDPAAISAEGPFGPYRVSFQYRGSRNEAMFLFEHQGGKLRQLRLMVARPGSDLVVSHYAKKGTNEELIDYLSDKANISEFMGSFQQLSDSVDEKHD